MVGRRRGERRGHCGAGAITGAPWWRGCSQATPGFRLFSHPNPAIRM